MSPGNEIIDKKELDEIKKIFTKSKGVLFAHGFDKRRKNIFRVRNFEKKLSEKFNSKYVQCVSSGTAAIKIALKALGVGRNINDEVITVSNTAIPTAAAIKSAGAKPIFVDVGDDYLINPLEIKYIFQTSIFLLKIQTICSSVCKHKVFQMCLQNK